MFDATPFRTTLGAAVMALAALGACSDAQEEVTGPPIPTLDGRAVDAGATGAPTGVETVSSDPLNAGCTCAQWSCAIATCGYDTANPPGACCTLCADENNSPQPKPSCDPGSGEGGDCSDEPGAGEWGVNLCDGTFHWDDQCDPGGLYETGAVCPAQFTCCHGGNYGDGPF